MSPKSLVLRTKSHPTGAEKALYGLTPSGLLMLPRPENSPSERHHDYKMCFVVSFTTTDSTLTNKVVLEWPARIDKGQMGPYSLENDNAPAPLISKRHIVAPWD
jgi:hypothetical protein